MSAALPEPSPGSTGVVHLWMLLGEVAREWRGDINKIRRMVMSIAGMRRKYDYFKEHHAHGDARFLLIAAHYVKSR
jgi:hypothetical protein